VIFARPATAHSSNPRPDRCGPSPCHASRSSWSAIGGKRLARFRPDAAFTPAEANNHPTDTYRGAGGVLGAASPAPTSRRDDDGDYRFPATARRGSDARSTPAGDMNRDMNALVPPSVPPSVHKPRRRCRFHGARTSSLSFHLSPARRGASSADDLLAFGGLRGLALTLTGWARRRSCFSRSWRRWGRLRLISISTLRLVFGRCS